MTTAADVQELAEYLIVQRLTSVKTALEQLRDADVWGYGPPSYLDQTITDIAYTLSGDELREVLKDGYTPA